MRSSPQRPKIDLGWTPSQRRGLLMLLTAFLVFLTIQFARNRRFVSDPQPTEGSRAAELDTRIDPNTADWQTLAAIPSLGEKRAKAIVAYREQARAATPGKTAFRSPDDLLQVRGIGAATIENLRPFLSFPIEPLAPAP
jgi:competence ComEA-like helix-hairpin-helix protein